MAAAPELIPGEARPRSEEVRALSEEVEGWSEEVGGGV